MSKKPPAQRYKEKALDSFNTKLNLFLFDYVVQSKREFSLSSFINFEITEELVKLYSTVYWQQEYESLVGNKTVNTIYHEMKKLRNDFAVEVSEFQADYVSNRFLSTFSFENFEELIGCDSCHYCGITVGEIEKLAEKNKLFKKTDRGWNLEIDRINSNYEYKRNNCVMACYWCNNAKTDEFTEEEFLEIGKAIRKVWDKRLGE